MFPIQPIDKLAIFVIVIVAILKGGLAAVAIIAGLAFFLKVIEMGKV